MNEIRLYKNYIYCFFSRNRKNKFSSLNCAYNRGDSVATVKKNRNFTSNYLNKNKIILTNQVHSNIVSYVDKNFSKEVNSDAMITNRKDILLGILTADCAPIIVLGKKYFGIIHAGWKGLINGIIENTIDKMIEIGSLRKNIHAIIGPTIQQHSYEIGNDLAIKIKCTTEYKSNNNILVEKSKKYFFNLPLFIKHKLNLNEINNISDVEIDTYLNKNFFSYRRTTQNRKSDSLKKATGRQVSVIGLK